MYRVGKGGSLTRRIAFGRESDHHASFVRKASDIAPVFITVRGTLKTVMLSYDRYRRLEMKAHRRTLLEVFSVPGFEKMMIGNTEIRQKEQR